MATTLILAAVPRWCSPWSQSHVVLVPVHALGERDILGEIEAFEAAPGLGHGEQLLARRTCPWRCGR